jgi:6-phosphogluconate dehydrogenase
MQIGVISLGRMGKQYPTPSSWSRPPLRGFRQAAGTKDFLARLERPRAVWIVLPAGEIAEQTVTALGAFIEPRDTLIDGSHSFYKDDIRRAPNLGAKKICYLDVGTSGGVWGFERRSLYTRFRSRQTQTFAEKLLSAMRNKFGGHVEPGKRK